MWLIRESFRLKKPMSSTERNPRVRIKGPREPQNDSGFLKELDRGTWDLSVGSTARPSEHCVCVCEMLDLGQTYHGDF